MDLSPTLRLDPHSDVPPFEQLRSQLAGRISAGELPAGARLPTVRALATDLGLATNTVARVYRELESDGVVETQGRRGTFVRSDLLDAGGADELATTYVRSARRLGLTLTEATRLVERAWTR